MIAVGYHIAAILGATSLAICGIGALVGRWLKTGPVEMEPSDEYVALFGRYDIHPSGQIMGVCYTPYSSVAEAERILAEESA